MNNRSKFSLEMPCHANNWKWRVYGIGMVWDHAQEWQARWKLHCLQASYETAPLNGQGRDTELPQ